VEESGTTDQRFAALVGSYSAMVVNTCHHYLRDADDAHDVAQEVFLAAFRHFDSMSDETAWRTWFYRTASHKSLNALRSRKRRAWLRPFDLLKREGTDATTVGIPRNQHPDRELESVDLRRALTEAIDRLPPRQRIAFVLHRHEELANSEIAAVMQLSVKAVDSLLHRARVFLQKQLLNEYRELRDK
jgi:RNA polymerase sigma-70 factor (ECF subfamily)